MDRAQAQAGGPGAHQARVPFSEGLEALKAAQKPSAGTPLYSRLVNRPLGRVLGAVAMTIGLGPNGISLVSASFSFAGIALVAFAQPSVGVALGITGLLVFGYALDSSDGQVARVTGRGSLLGEWLDHMIDAAKVASLHAAVCWSALHHADPARGWAAVALLYGIVASVLFFGMILTDQLRRAAGVPKQAATSGSSDLVRALLVLPTDYGVLCLLFLLFGATSVFYPVYGLLGAANLLLLAVAVSRWVGQLRGIDRERSAS
ncbi:MAG TPA: CDP-alcohol phosphatidyltransferase family protein [Ornithinibacter sp.]|nr:CDP-alcohol phosphatidyltransferase family protein [Ornithinibacter sp.]